jgi:hypothetical protein
MPLLADYSLPDHEWVAESEVEISPAISGRTGFENKQSECEASWATYRAYRRAVQTLE